MNDHAYPHNLVKNMFLLFYAWLITNVFKWWGVLFSVGQISRMWYMVFSEIPQLNAE